MAYKQRHFIFGYGSLICHRSRAVTAPSLASKPAMPVLVEHLARTWSARIPHQKDSTSSTGKELKQNTNDILHGQTAMGIERAWNTKCIGVLIEVDDVELDYFDAREGGYDRVEIDLLHIHGLNDNEDLEDSHVVLEKASHKRKSQSESKTSDSGDLDDVKVWVYIPHLSLPANKNYPIVQSYVDIIMRGCLDYSSNFVAHFLNTTHGWWHHELGQDKDNIPLDGNAEELDHFVWIEDRENPLYVRADITWSKEQGALLDQYLESHMPLAFTKRRNLDRILGAAEKFEEEFD